MADSDFELKCKMVRFNGDCFVRVRDLIMTLQDWALNLKDEEKVIVRVIIRTLETMDDDNREVNQ